MNSIKRGGKEEIDGSSSLPLEERKGRKDGEIDYLMYTEEK